MHCQWWVWLIIALTRLHASSSVSAGQSSLVSFYRCGHQYCGQPVRGRFMSSAFSLCLCLPVCLSVCLSLLLIINFSVDARESRDFPAQLRVHWVSPTLHHRRVGVWSWWHDVATGHYNPALPPQSGYLCEHGGGGSEVSDDGRAPRAFRAVHWDHERCALECGDRCGLRPPGRQATRTAATQLLLHSTLMHRRTTMFWSVRVKGSTCKELSTTGHCSDRWPLCCWDDTNIDCCVLIHQYA